MSVIALVRHGQNEVNVDRPVRNYRAARLTPVGLTQAYSLGVSWATRPPLVATSPFTSAVETATVLYPGQIDLPHDERFREFSYLSPSRTNNTSRAQRALWARRYWQAHNPHYRDGHDSETFAEFAARVRVGLSGLNAHGEECTVVTHGMVIAMSRILSQSDHRIGLDLLFERFVHDVQTGGIVPNCSVTEVRTDRRSSS